MERGFCPLRPAEGVERRGERSQRNCQLAEVMGKTAVKVGEPQEL